MRRSTEVIKGKCLQDISGEALAEMTKEMMPTVYLFSLCRSALRGEKWAMEELSRCALGGHPLARKLVNKLDNPT